MVKGASPLAYCVCNSTNNIRCNCNGTIFLNCQDCAWLTAVCAFIAGVFPAIYKALDLDVSLKTVADHAHIFKVLQDKFRQAWTISAHGSIDEFSIQFNELANRMDVARSASLTPPESFFLKAKKKIEAGHYKFEVDNN